MAPSSRVIREAGAGRPKSEQLDDLRDTTVSVYYVPMVFAFDSIQGGISEQGDGSEFVAGVLWGTKYAARDAAKRTPLQ